MSHKKKSVPAAAPARRGGLSTLVGERRNDLLILAAIIAGVALYRFVSMASQPGPPGSDGGNWLAFTHDLFGSSTKAAESMYFPGTLVVLRLLQVFLPDLEAIKTLAVLSSVAAGVPMYFLARRCCTPLTSVYVTVLFLMAGFLSEMLSWGGYPQLLGTAYLLATLYLLDCYLQSGERRDLAWSAIAAALVCATHHFTVLIMAATLPVYLCWIAWRERSRLVALARRCVAWGGLAGGLSLLTMPWYLRYLSLLSGDGTLNASGEQLHGFGDVLSYVFSEAPLTWVALASLVPLAAMLPLGGERTARLRPMAAALTAGPLIVYLATGEGRVVQPMQAGMMLCLGIVATMAADFLSKARVSVPIARMGVATQALAALGLLMILVMNGHARWEDALSRYGALDANAVQALTWLRDETPSDSAILPGDRSGWVSYAWWVEGYAQRPAYGLIDPSFLAFKQEKEQSAVAMRIMDPRTPADETRELLQQAGIQYFFIYIPSGGAFQSLVERVPSKVAFQNDEFVIYKVDDSSNAAASTAR